VDLFFLLQRLNQHDSIPSGMRRQK
jgi:hypothetical protein